MCEVHRLDSSPLKTLLNGLFLCHTLVCYCTFHIPVSALEDQIHNWSTFELVFNSSKFLYTDLVTLACHSPIKVKMEFRPSGVSLQNTANSIINEAFIRSSE